MERKQAVAVIFPAHPLNWIESNTSSRKQGVTPGAPQVPLSSPRSPPGGQSHPQMLPIPQFLGQLSPGNCTTLPPPHLLIITPSPLLLASQAPRNRWVISALPPDTRSCSTNPPETSAAHILLVIQPRVNTCDSAKILVNCFDIEPFDM